MPATTTCFSSNLGAKALECNPQDVTGTQRYKFFATALTGSGHKETLLTLSDNINQTTKTSPQSQSKAQKQQKSTERSNNNLPPPIFQESSTQTNDVKVLPSLPSLSSFSSNENNEPNKEQQLMAEIQLEKIAREKERKEQEAALPPVTDKQSLEAYRIFLEENEKKDFALREKELDEMMKLKLKSIEENLYERYMNSSLLNQEKVEVNYITTLLRFNRIRMYCAHAFSISYLFRIALSIPIVL